MSDVSALLQAQADTLGIVRVLDPGVYLLTRTLHLGRAGRAICLELGADVRLVYAPESGEPSAIRLYGYSSIHGTSRFGSTIEVRGDGCHGIDADVSVGVPWLSGFRVLDACLGRTAGDGIHFGVGSFRGSFENLEIDGFIDGVSLHRPFATSLRNVNAAGAQRDGYHIEGSSPGLHFDTCYANNNRRHGFYFSGHQAYCTLRGVHADINGNHGYYLDKDAEGNACHAFTFDSPSVEVTNGAACGMHFEEGDGHVINAPYLYSGAGTGDQHALRFAGTRDVRLQAGWMMGWRGNMYEAVRSRDGQIPARLSLTPPHYSTIERELYLDPDQAFQ